MRRTALPLCQTSNLSPGGHIRGTGGEGSVPRRVTGRRRQRVCVGVKHVCRYIRALSGR